jgi:MoaA/NifB/PqqE/SkfB family radical SAM enzyme
MPDSKIFCNIPWYELHINHDGSYDLCGCMSSLITQTADAQEWNIRNYSIDEYWNSRRLRDERISKMGDVPNPACSVCQYQDSIGNHSKRIKENLKSVIFYDRFDRSYQQSPHRKIFEHSLNNDGATTTQPVSYHLSLGNECDLACIMCSPNASYKLARDYQELGWAGPARRLNWTDDANSWRQVCETLAGTDDLLSLHIIGGEPTINKRFTELIDYFVEQGKTDFSFSFTTNCMHPIDHLWDKLSKFKRVEIGLSTETVTKSNDYVRYGSNIDTILLNIAEFKMHAPENVDFVVRTVPTFLTITEYSQLIDWCYDNEFLLNSYFAVDPLWQQIKLLPAELKQELAREFDQQLARYQLLQSEQQQALTNFRNQTRFLDSIVNEVRAARQAVSDTTTEPKLLAEAIAKLTELDARRRVSAADVFPRLREFLYANGYRFTV